MKKKVKTAWKKLKSIFKKEHKDIKLEEVPIPKHEYHFFDDGKLHEHRHYIAKINRIIPYKYAKKRMKSLVDVWRYECVNCDWLYAPKTDYFVEAYVKGYEKGPIYFVRTKYGEWFSINYTGWWQTGHLDVNGKLYEYLNKRREENKTQTLI